MTSASTPLGSTPVSLFGGDTDAELIGVSLLSAAGIWILTKDPVSACAALASVAAFFRAVYGNRREASAFSAHQQQPQPSQPPVAAQVAKPTFDAARPQELRAQAAAQAASARQHRSQSTPPGGALHGRD